MEEPAALVLQKKKKKRIRRQTRVYRKQPKSTVTMEVNDECKVEEIEEDQGNVAESESESSDEEPNMPGLPISHID